MPPVIKKDVCTVCGTCVEICPGDVLYLEEDGPQITYPDECWHCGNCRIHCPVDAVDYVFPLDMVI